MISWYWLLLAIVGGAAIGFIATFVLVWWQ